MRPPVEDSATTMVPRRSFRRCPARSARGIKSCIGAHILLLHRTLGARLLAPTRAAYDATNSEGGRDRMRAAAVLLFAFALLAQPANSEPYPDHPIRLISPNPAGGANDTIVRIIAAKMSTILGVSVVIDNRGGAGGKIGAEAGARATPDGYTLLAGSVSTHSFAPVVTPRLG